jgi:hypothetical protein
MPKVNAGSDSAAAQKFSHAISTFHSISRFFHFSPLPRNKHTHQINPDATTPKPTIQMNTQTA